jgi:putative endonuclease
LSKHNALGVRGEILACEFLQKKEYAILEINWRFSHYEVDIIAKHQNVLIFAEVKTRSTDYFGFPESAVDKEKQQRLAKAADEYMEQNNLEMDIRFDIISIIIKNEEPEIIHLEDAFFPYDG